MVNKLETIDRKQTDHSDNQSKNNNIKERERDIEKVAEKTAELAEEVLRNRFKIIV